ncbi:MAG: hypothetical protein ACE5Z5_09780 [Candidatus Bathyarchaeia archaeon]
MVKEAFESYPGQQRTPGPLKPNPAKETQKITLEEGREEMFIRLNSECIPNQELGSLSQTDNATYTQGKTESKKG